MHIYEELYPETISIVNELLAEGKIGSYTPPFRVKGLWIVDADGRSVLEVTSNSSVPKQIAMALNMFSKKSLAESLIDYQASNFSIIREMINMSDNTFKLKKSKSIVTLYKNSKIIAKFTPEEWEDLIDAVKNRVSGLFGDIRLKPRADSFYFVDRSGEEVAYFSPSEMDILINE